MCTRTGTAAAGAWSGAAPTCIKACPDPPAIQANGAPNVPAVGPYNFNALVAYSCVATHALQGTTPNVCEDKNGATDTTCTNGAWSNPIPTCVAACTAPPASAVGAATATPNNPSNPQTTQVTYTCPAAGTSLVGTATITCQATRVWSPAVAPDCVTDCPAPPTIAANGAANVPAVGPYKIGTTVTYSCAANFDLKGSATNMCQRVGAAAAGTWTSTTAPTCVTADKDLDIVFILDGNNPLDDCTTKTSTIPVLP
uniref:Sushi domain-containing protein n=1 Tax=Ciona savignyi TaxID=51511 RepID=H2YQG4_CIOSA